MTQVTFNRVDHNGRFDNWQLSRRMLVSKSSDGRQLDGIPQGGWSGMAVDMVHLKIKM